MAMSTEDNRRMRFESNPPVRFEDDPRMRFESNRRMRLEDDPRMRLEDNPRMRFESNPPMRFEDDPRMRFEGGNPRRLFEGEIALVPYNSRPGIRDFSKPTTGTDRSLEDVLDSEAADNESFLEAWTEAGNCYKLPELVKTYKKTLKRSEIKLIMAYTYGGITGFFSELNEDFRNNALTGGRFPNAKRILRNAVIDLEKFQKKSGMELPGVLYRWEPSFLADKYREQGDGKLQLNMFTSTSLMRGCNFNPQNNMLVEFRKPATGAFIRDFSFYPLENEVLLPPLRGKIKVMDASEDGSILQGPVLSVWNKIASYFLKY